MNILIAGVGGQGVVLASKVLAECAIRRGLNVRTAETIGMAQRGGCVLSHVRIGDYTSPLIPRACADAVIAFEPTEAVRALLYLKPDRAMAVCTTEINPTSDSASLLHHLYGRVVLLDGAEAADASGSTKTLNVSMLGAAAAARVIEFTASEIEAVLRVVLPGKYMDMNIAALRFGAESWRNYEA